MSCTACPFFSRTSSNERQERSGDDDGGDVGGDVGGGHRYRCCRCRRRVGHLQNIVLRSGSRPRAMGWSSVDHFLLSQTSAQRSQERIEDRKQKTRKEKTQGLMQKNGTLAE